MKILIFGAEGMLGKDMVCILSERHQVVGRDINHLDIRGQDRVREEIGTVQPDVVINAAAYTDVDGCESHKEMAFSINAEGTRNIALGCLKTGARMIHLSTDYVFDGSSPIPYREEDPPNPINIYGASKREGESYIEKNLTNYLLIRTAWLYGVHGKNFVKAILRQAAEKKELRVVNDQRGSPTFTKDLIWGIMRLIDTDVTGKVHVTNSGSCTWFEFAKGILKEKGIRDVQVVPISSHDLGRAAKRPANSLLDCSMFEKLTGARMRPWEEALSEYLCPFSRE